MHRPQSPLRQAERDTDRFGDHRAVSPSIATSGPWPAGEGFRDRQARRQARRLDAEQVDEPADAMILFGLDEEVGRRTPGRAIFGRMPA